MAQTPPTRSISTSNDVHGKIERIHQVRDGDSEGASHAAEDLSGFLVSLNREVVNRLGAEFRIGICRAGQLRCSARCNRLFRHADNRRGRHIARRTRGYRSRTQAPRLRVMWPNSPAIPVMPCQIRPPSTIPPPTPVPSVNMIMSSTSRPAPLFTEGGDVGVVLENHPRIQEALDLSLHRRFRPSPANWATPATVARLHVNNARHSDADSLQRRGIPIFGGRPLNCIAHLMDDMVLAQCHPGSERHLFIRWPCWLTAAMRRLVPPRSTPMEKLFIAE